MSKEEGNLITLNTNFPAFQQTNVDKQTNLKNSNFDFELNSYWNNYANNNSKSNLTDLEIKEDSAKKVNLKLEDYSSQFPHYYCVFQLSDSYPEFTNHSSQNYNEEQSVVKRIQSNLPVSELKALQQLTTNFLFAKRFIADQGINIELVDLPTISQTITPNSSNTLSNTSTSSVNTIPSEKHAFSSLLTFACLINLEKTNHSSDNNLSEETEVKQEFSEEKKILRHYIVCFLVEQSANLTAPYFEL